MHYILFSTPKTPKEYRNVQEPPSPLAHFGEPALELPSLRQWKAVCSKDWPDNVFASNSASAGTSSSGSTESMSIGSSSEELINSFFASSGPAKDSLPRTPTTRTDEHSRRYTPPGKAKKDSFKRCKRRAKLQAHDCYALVAKRPL